MHKKIFWDVAAYAFIGLVTLNVFFSAYIQPLGFDDSFNLQIAKSLANNFIYQSTYYPRYIYDHRISTNGLIQYVAALNLKFFGDRAGLAITLALVSAFTLTASLKYSWKTFIAFAILVISYPIVGSLMTVFLGEIVALGFLILGVYFTEKHLSDTDRPSANADLFLSVIFYGLAISSKLIVIVVLPFILFGLLFSPKVGDRSPFLTAIRASFVAYLFSVLVFFAFYYASVLHSQLFLALFGRQPSDFFVSDLGIIKFIQHHFWQQSTVSSGNMLDYRSYSSPLLLPVLIASLAFLAWKSRGWIPLWLIVILTLLKGGLHERRLFFFVVPTLLISARYLFDSPRFGVQRKGVYTVGVKYLPDIAVSALWISFVVFAYNINYTFPFITSRFDAAKNVWLASKGNSGNFVVKESVGDVIQAIKSEGSPVITSGWWQFPDYQVFADISFYDRMEPGVASFLKGDRSLLLVFDPTIKTWPETSIKMCTQILIEKPNFILCRYDMSLPLNHRCGIN